MVVLLHQRTLDWLYRFQHNSESQKSLANEMPELQRRTQGELGMPMYHNWPHLVLIHKPSIHSKTKLLHFIVQWSESTLCQRKPHVASVVMLTGLLHTHTGAHTCWHTQPQSVPSVTHTAVSKRRAGPKSVDQSAPSGMGRSTLPVRMADSKNRAAKRREKGAVWWTEAVIERILLLNTAWLGETSEAVVHSDYSVQ